MSIAADDDRFYLGAPIRSDEIFGRENPGAWESAAECFKTATGRLSVQPPREAAGNSVGKGVATPCQALGKGIDLIVVAPGKRQQFGGEVSEP